MQTDNTLLLQVENLRKHFTLHMQGGIDIPVFEQANLALHAGDCMVLDGPSGTGKSTLLRCIYANYRAQGGRILVRHQGEMVDMVTAEPREILSIRRHTLGYVSQFLRVIPRVNARDLVMEPLLEVGVDESEARERSEAMLARLNLPKELWELAPATFSGGEQQRVNIARGFIAGHPILLLDEPTASLDAANRRVVIEMIQTAREEGKAVIGIFHDAEVRDAVSNQIFDVTRMKQAA